jgi:hypothetical protein
MVSPLLSLSRMAASMGHLSHVLYPAPIVAESHIVGEWCPSYRDLCPYPFPSLGPGLDPCHGLVGVGRRVVACGICNPVRPASYLIQEREGVCSQQQMLRQYCSRLSRKHL